ncbi:hypothetical protein FB45DRAFT_797400, partial [Roridomyces roridus]
MHLPADCADCHSVPAMTSQCTDQCVVVACTEQAPYGCPGTHCDLECEDRNCKDCSGFDEFLQCCTDFHSYYEEPTWMWDPALKTFVCSCNSAATTSGYSTPSSIPEPLHSCMWSDCGASFAQLSDLVEHVNLMHLAPAPPVACQWKDCTIFPTPETVPGPSSGDMDALLGVLSSHLLHDHLGLHPPPPLPSEPELAPAECHTCHWSSCGQTFASVDDLTLHLNNTHVGTGKASYECFWGDCPRHGNTGFSSKQKLCRHLQSHTGHRPFQCKLCQQNFSEAATLQQHMRRHTQEKPYLCDYPGCGKSFAITGALTIHKRTHNGDKPFKCPHCQKAFAESSNLSKHLRTHTGARPYSCSEPGCNKSFARADQLTRHSRVHRK